MKTTILTMTLFMLFVLFGNVSIALAYSYVCEIEYVYDLADNNSLKVSSLEKQYKGKMFSISRVDGDIGGDDVIPALLPRSSKMLHLGTGRHSFQALAKHIIGRQMQFQLIEILEFKEGKRKPFVITYMNGSGIVTGNCI